IPFAQKEGAWHWQHVSKKLVEGYGTWLDDEGYSYATEYLELTALKQILKWLASESKIPPSCLFLMPLKKPQGTTTYCYRPEEVEAILAHCSANPECQWLGEVLLALVTTGLRISELASLRWPDVDLQA